MKNRFASLPLVSVVSLTALVGVAHSEEKAPDQVAANHLAELGPDVQVFRRGTHDDVVVRQGPVMPATLYATGERIQLETETVLRPMCGTRPGALTAGDLIKIDAAHRAQMADLANVTIINRSGPSALGQRGGTGGLDLVFNASGLPAGAADALADVEAYIESQFGDPVTVIITVGFANLGGGVLGSTGSNYASNITWATARAGLQADMDFDDTIQTSLPAGSTLPVRYNGNSDAVTNEDRVFFTVANFLAAIGSVGGTAAGMTFNSEFPWDFDPSNGINGGTHDFQSVIAHEVGHALGFTSAADFRPNDVEALDIYRFQFSDGASDFNPDDLAEFGTTPRMVDQNAPGTADDVISDIISDEHRMSDGSPNQASHFSTLEPFLMDPNLGTGESFFPNFLRLGDTDMFDAIGWDFPRILPLFVGATPPALVAPEVTAVFTVTVDPNDETLVPGTETLFYRFDGGVFLSTPLTLVSGTTYEATLPAPMCGDTPEFYVSSESVESGVVTDPTGAPATFFTAEVGVSTVVFTDDVEVDDMTWTLGEPGDTATTGIWERVDPVGTAAQPENDNTDPGVFCFVTGQGLVGGGLGDNDVDGGFTTLLSPIVATNPADDPIVSYWRWYSNDSGAGPNDDVFLVEIAADGGAWINAETVGPAGAGVSGGWIFHSFRVLDFVTPVSSIQVRFIADDGGATGSLVEAGVDDFDVSFTTCSVMASCPADFNGDGFVGSADFATLLGAWGGSGAPDLDMDGFVGSGDLALLLGAWGACP